MSSILEVKKKAGISYSGENLKHTAHVSVSNDTRLNSVLEI